MVVVFVFPRIREDRNRADRMLGLERDEATDRPASPHKTNGESSVHLILALRGTFFLLEFFKCVFSVFLRYFKVFNGLQNFLDSVFLNPSIDFGDTSKSTAFYWVPLSLVLNLNSPCLWGFRCSTVLGDAVVSGAKLTLTSRLVESDAASFLSLLSSCLPGLSHSRSSPLFRAPAGYGEGDALNLSSKSDSRDDLSDAPTPRDDKDEALSDADDLDDKNGKLPGRVASPSVPTINFFCLFFTGNNS